MAKPRLVRIAVALAVLLGAIGSAGQGAPPDLDAYVARVMKEFQVPGLSVAIVKDRKTVLAKGYGVRKLNELTPVDERTLFGIGSNTKAFTTAALATLVDEGKLSWDDPVYQRLPGFQMYDPYVAHEMTIRDLLTHRSGMGLGEGDLLFIPHTTYTRDDIINRLRFMKPKTSFRSGYAYDNLLYVAAGQIIPAVTGKSWDDYIRERIFAPVGMTSSTVSNTVFKPGDNYAYPHSKVNEKLQVIDFSNIDNVAPAGAINSCAADMARWALVQLGHGKLPDGDGRLFSEQRSREMWSPQTILPINDPPAPLAALKPNFADYGLGWFLSDYHGRKLVRHGGGVPGFVSMVLLVPEVSLGIVVLTNAEETDAVTSIVYHLLDQHLGLAPADWVAAFKAAEELGNKEAAEAEKKQAASRAADSKPSLPLEKYVGVYKDTWYGSATIRLDNGGLVLTFDQTPGMVGDLEHWQYDTFKTHWHDPTTPDAFVTFALKADGGVDHFKMVAVSSLADFSYDYQDLYFEPVTSSGSR
jgi:CubicO group peptidase (beta-lactamase class C family)